MLFYKNKEIDHSKKVRSVDISIYRLFELLKEGNNVKVAEGIPKESCLIGTYYNSEKNVISLRIENKDFEIIPEGGLVPIMDIIMEENSYNKNFPATPTNDNIELHKAIKTQEEKEKRLKEWKEKKKEKWLAEGLSIEEVEAKLAEHKILK